MNAHQISGDVVVVENEGSFSGTGTRSVNKKRSTAHYRNGVSPLSAIPDQNTPRNLDRVSGVSSTKKSLVGSPKMVSSPTSVVNELLSSTNKNQPYLPGKF